MDRGDFIVVGGWEANDDFRHTNGLARRLPVGKLYADIAKNLDELKQEAVVSYGSVLEHMQVVEACAPRGHSRDGEEPLATTYRQALRMKKLAEKYGIKKMVNYETTWYASNHHAYQIARSDRLGDIRRINVCDRHQGPKEIGCSDMFLG